MPEQTALLTVMTHQLAAMKEQSQTLCRALEATTSGYGRVRPLEPPVAPIVVEQPPPLPDKEAGGLLGGIKPEEIGQLLGYFKMAYDMVRGGGGPARGRRSGGVAVILDPVNDTECLGQLTAHRARALVDDADPIRRAHLGTREHGDRVASVVAADRRRRRRARPVHPVRRAAAGAACSPTIRTASSAPIGAMMLLEALERRRRRGRSRRRQAGCGTRASSSGSGRHWHAVDLFPRRNGQRELRLGAFGESVLHGTHDYVGKPILKFYLGDTGGQLADTLGEQEDKLGPAKQPQKKPSPSPAVAKRGVEQPSRPSSRPPAGAIQHELPVGNSAAARGRTETAINPTSGEEEKMARRKKTRVVREPPAKRTGSRRRQSAQYKPQREVIEIHTTRERKRNASGGVLVTRQQAVALSSAASSRAAARGARRGEVRATPGVIAGSSAPGGLHALSRAKQNPSLNVPVLAPCVGAATRRGRAATRRRFCEVGASRSRRRRSESAAEAPWRASQAAFVTREELNEALCESRRPAEAGIAI